MLPEAYPYEALPPGKVFRYIVLQPGLGDEPLRCSLRIGGIAETQFEAISYVWGQITTKDHTIECDGYSMAITASLFTVLQRVRLPDRALLLWADSISINQSNLDEKGQQVALMGKIYRAAKRVLIWVGADINGQGPALSSLLDEVDVMIESTRQNLDGSWDSFPFPDKDDPILADNRWHALQTLLTKDWFDRGWVVQEAASAPHGQVMWGQSCFEWDKLMRVYIWMSTRAHSIYYPMSFGDVQINSHMNTYLEGHQVFGKLFYSDLSWGTPSLLRTLNFAKELDVSDPSDRIYAFMDLLRSSEQHIRIKPDYHTSHLKTYHQFAVQYIQSTASTELLDYVNHDAMSLSDAVPSWVPRWDICTWSLSQNSMASSLAASRDSTTVQPSIVNDNCELRVRAVIVDTVRFVSGVFDWETTTAETIREIWEVVSSTSTDGPYTELSADHQLNAFLNSLNSGTYAGEFLEWRRAIELFVQEAQLRHGDGVSDPSNDTVTESDDAGSNLFLDHIKNRTHNRRFVLTQRGYMGLAPMPTQKDDLCGIVFGCKTPCILRKASQEKHYLYVGATTLVGKDSYEAEGGGVTFCDVLGEDDSRDWVEWDVEEDDIYLC